jgi:hypothetical protein
MKKSLFILSAFFGILGVAIFSYGQEKTTTTTTTVEQATVTSQPPSKTSTVRKKSTKKTTSAKPVDTSTSVISTTTTTVTPPPPKIVPRTVYDEETLKKMSPHICTDGFKAYVGTAKKNVCLKQATPPDIAYSCVWNKKGTPAYASTQQGPCNLDFTEHHGSITIKKDEYASDPPLPYGTEAQCCFRASKGPEVPASSK